MRTLAILLALAVPVFGQTWSLMHFTPSSPEEVRLFSHLGLDAAVVYPDGSCDFVAGDEERILVRQYGLPVTTRIPDMSFFYSSMYREPVSMGGFLTWDEVQLWMDSLHAANPDITSPPTSIGDTYEGRPQLVMKISENNSFYSDDPAMPNAWYDGLIHGREGASMRNIRYFMMWLCGNRGRNGYCGYQADWILANRELWFLPVNNVDGWVYNQTTNPGGGGMQRKNRNLSAGGNGVDLNRNWAVGWGGAGSSGSPSAETYRGTAPLSEPETANVDAFWQEYTPAQMHSTHTYSNVLLYPWGWIDEPTTHAAEYTASGEIMVLWSTGEAHYPTVPGFYYASGNTADHSYGLYGSMSWIHEIGASFAGFWPSPTEVVKLSRRNLRSYLASAFLAGRPYDPAEPGVPVLDGIGDVPGDFTVNWNDVPGASYYALQRLEGYQVLLNDIGDSGPFDRVNWTMTSSHYHSGTQCYRSDGTGTMTWQETVTVPPGGGGRISFWSMQDIVQISYQGAFSYSPDGGANWYYLQTFGRDDMNWRYNLHELDEWQGETLSFRWESYGSVSNCALYIDDIKVEIWEDNEIEADGIGGSQHTVSGLPAGEYWFRAWAVDDSFGPGWPGQPEYANVTGVGIEQERPPVPDTFLLGLISPNPASSAAMIPVSLGSVEGTTLQVLDLAGRVVEDLSPRLSPGTHSVQFDAAGVPAGIYFVRLHGPSASATARLLIVR